MNQSTRQPAASPGKTTKPHSCFLTSLFGSDAIDLELDDLNVVDPYEVHAPSRRSDKNLGYFLSLLDSLETATDRKEITR